MGGLDRAQTVTSDKILLMVFISSLIFSGLISDRKLNEYIPLSLAYGFIGGP